MGNNSGNKNTNPNEPNYHWRPKTKKQKQLLTSVMDFKVDSLITGIPGSGKTFVIVNAILDLYDNGKIDQILLARPARGTCEGLGYDAGDSDEKMSGWVKPMLNVMRKRYGADKYRTQLKRMIEDESLVLQPLHKITGMDIERAVLVVDEVQGVNVATMKSLVTRINTSGKLILSGDGRQVILKGSTGLDWLLDKIDRSSTDFGFTCTHFDDIKDCQRDGRVANRISDMMADGEY